MDCRRNHPSEAGGIKIAERRTRVVILKIKKNVENKEEKPDRSGGLVHAESCKDMKRVGMFEEKVKRDGR